MASLDAPSTQPGATLVRLLWLSTLVLVLISVAMVTRSALTVFGFMSASSALSNAVSPDAMFARSASLTLIHIVPGLAFVMLGSLQFVGRLRRSRPRLHRSDRTTRVDLGIGYRRNGARDDHRAGDRGCRGKGRHGALWRHLCGRVGSGFRVHPSSRSGSPSRMDDSGVRVGPGRRDRPAHRRRVLRNAKADPLDASRVFWNRVLDWLYDAPGGGGVLDSPNAPPSSRCRCASSSHRAIFSSFTACKAQPCAVAFQR